LRLEPRDVKPVVGRLSDGLPAAAAGIEVGDRILRINGNEIAGFSDIEKVIREESAKNPRLAVVVQRANEQLDFQLEAIAQTGADGKSRYLIGIGSPDAHDATLKYDPLAAVPRAFAETWDVTLSSLKMLKMLIVGQAS